MKQTTLEEAKQLNASGYFQRLPVYREIFSDIRTPVEALKILKGVSSHCFLLESIEDRERWGRYTFLGYDPTMELTCVDGRMTMKIRRDRETPDGAGGAAGTDRPGSLSGQEGFQIKTWMTRSPQEEIRRLLEENRSPKVEGLPTFSGGLVGYFSYDYLKYSEPSLKFFPKTDEDFRDMDLMMFDKVIAFDNFRQKIFLIVHIRTEQLEREYERAVKTLDEMEQLLEYGTPARLEPGRLTSEFRQAFSREEYCRKVEQVKEHIREGDIFQLVLANPMEADFEGSLLNTYRVLRTTNPSPYMLYFSGDDLEIAGASPETLVKVTDGEVRTFPLAGTRPRGKTPREDLDLERELLADEKELAEHNMLVDLGRNDLGKISRFGTVSVDKYLLVERFSHVMHIGSEVHGQLKPEFTAVDAVDAVLPAGTLSGAPKIRACEIIHELEGRNRGIYGGAIGYLDFTGNMDTCISIRLAYKRKGKVYVCSGAGIVADSVPEKEYEECRNKARAVIQALEDGERGRIR